MTIQRVLVEQLQEIGDLLASAAEQVQDNVDEAAGYGTAAGEVAGEARDSAREAHERADVAHERLDLVEQQLASWPTGGTGGGFGPDTVAGADVLDSIKAAVRAGGGSVSPGTGDDGQLLQDTVTRHGRLQMIGTLRTAQTIRPPARRMIVGTGPATNVVGLAGLSGAFFLSTADHNWYSDFTVSAGAEAAGTHHIHTNITSATGFSTGADACTVIQRIVSRNAKGRPVIVEGFNNRDAKLNALHCWNAAQGVLLNSPDGRAHDLIAGTCGGAAGIELGSSSANWHVAGKSWYSEGDGILADGSRHTLLDVEGQDSRRAGIRLVGYEIELLGWLADSNSWWSGSPVTGVNSGLELGLTPASMSGTTWSPGTAKGGYDLVVGPGKAFDKNEGKRGVQQRFGVLARPGIRGLSMTGVTTGAVGGHQNLIDGIKFLTASDVSHPENAVAGCLSHRVRVQS